MLNLFAMIMDDSQRGFMEALYFEHRRAMYGTAFDIVKNHHDAEDIVQDILLKLTKKYLC